ncbi:MAG: hypothetical protein IEMM0003_0291 [bacterium]|nr:MAG: hypothetical protein IEMM0003_0291 [bacterium]
MTRSTDTKIALQDGEKVLISGLIKNDKSYTEERVPLLSSIPLFGELFKYKKVDSEKTNLMIFLTAKIINSRQELNNLTKKHGKS